MSCSDTPERIGEKMIAAHLPLIEQAAREGVQVLGLQELFNLPYIGAEQDNKWYRSAEPVPDGPTVERMRAEAGRLGMAMVVPVYEEAADRRLLQHRRGDRRRRALSRQVPQGPHPPCRGLLRKILFQARRHRLSGVRDRSSARSASISATTGTSPKAGASSP